MRATLTLRHLADAQGLGRARSCRSSSPSPTCRCCFATGSTPSKKTEAIAETPGRMSDPILSIRGLRKQYATGVEALKAVDLDIRRGEIFALLGPNGAGKTTMISIICGIVNATAGEVLIDGKNWQKHLSRSAHAHRPRSAGADAGRVRAADQHGQLQPRTVRPRAQSGQDRGNPSRAVAVGQAQDDPQGIVRRHEAARDDRQGARPRSRHPVPRRAHRRRRRRASPRHVEHGPPPPRGWARPSSSRPTTSRKPRRWPTGSASSTRAS